MIFGEHCTYIENQDSETQAVYSCIISFNWMSGNTGTMFNVVNPFVAFDSIFRMLLHAQRLMYNNYITSRAKMQPQWKFQHHKLVHNKKK